MTRDTEKDDRTSKIDPKEIQRLGFHFAYGAAQLIGMLALVGLVLNMILPTTDDSDLSRWHRSGLKVATDAKTGKQYLLSPDGGIIERATIEKKGNL